MIGNNLKSVLEQIEKDKGIPTAELIEMVEHALDSAYQKHARGENYKARVDAETGKIKVFARRKVVRTPKDPATEIKKTDALSINPAAKAGDIVEVEVDASKFSRIAAQTAKQIIIQKIRENERENVFKEFKQKEGRVVTANVFRFLDGSCIMEVEGVESILPAREQIKKEKLSRGSMLKVYILEVNKSGRGPRIIVSRTHPGLVEGLFSLEVPEIVEGEISVNKIVREPGIRCKVAVSSKNPRIDPIGACVGINGVRVQAVINELGGERMDLIKYSPDINKFLKSSLSPAEVREVKITDPEKKEASVVVSNEMLSLAIGKNGQNVRLAARLTGWHIDIQSESEAKEKKAGVFEKNYSDIKSLSGVGEKTARLIIDQGIDSLKKLAGSDPEILKAIEGVGLKTAGSIIEEARLKLKKREEEEA